MPVLVSVIITVDCLGRRTRDSLLSQRTPECSHATCDKLAPKVFFGRIAVVIL
jgi:hypothetical protein